MKTKPVPATPVQNVTPAPARILQRACACGQHSGGGQCAECQKKREMGLQRAAVDASPVNDVPVSVYEVLQSPGQPLDDGTRAFMEPRFGHDFSGVRVHTDAKAAESARAVNALAYTVGQDIVFANGQYIPEASVGQKLIAHELTHVAQQTKSSGLIAWQPKTLALSKPENIYEREADRVSERVVTGHHASAIGQDWSKSIDNSVHAIIQRQTPGGSRVPARTITQIDVNQTTPQRVTITWSDGTNESDECSTGKGHCCFDESLGEGGVCSEGGSRAGGSNCTPIGNFRVTTKIPRTAGDVELWTQFVDNRSIALHDYGRVDGTPLSHGCVRLHRPMAQKIFDGSVEGRTRVTVRNLAQPRCNHGALLREWLHDFSTAGTTPPDGERIDPDTGQRRTREELAKRARRRVIIRRERRDLMSALGVNEDELDQVISGLQTPTNNLSTVSTRSAQEALLANIPRCVPMRTTEEMRVPDAISSGVASQPRVLRPFRRALNRSGSLRAARTIVRRFGQGLWDDATQRAQASSPNSDDRPLYWSRLQMTETIRQFSAVWMNRLNPDQTRRGRQELIDIFERASRGMQDIGFRGDAQGIKRILISGFDPFRLDSGFSGDIQQGNPSGAVALALDGQLISAGGVDGRVQAVIFPVRYADFDAGVVENLFRPFLTGQNPADMIITVSMGSSSNFELERYAGRRRSSTFPENVGASGNQPASQGSTRVPPPEIRGIGPGPEFLRTNMLREENGRLVRTPALEAMQRRLGRSLPLESETAVREIQSGTTRITRSTRGPTSGSRAFEGSGGGFLSNEIFYRTSLLHRETGATTQVIHLHTPLLAPDASATERDRIVTTVRGLIEAALPNL